MKQKIKQFFHDKKEILLFVGVLTIVFASVILIANLALGSKDDTSVNGGNTAEIPDNPVQENPTVPETPVVVLFEKPVESSTQIIRVFFEKDKSKDLLTSAVVSYNSTYYESKGVTYANADDSQFNVYAMYDGVVLDVKEDETYGKTVEIKHDSNVISIYNSLSSVTVTKGDRVSGGDQIGVAGTNAFDSQASIHVGVEVKVGSVFVDPEMVYGKTLDEVELLVETQK